MESILESMQNKINVNYLTFVPIYKWIALMFSNTVISTFHLEFCFHLSRGMLVESAYFAIKISRLTYVRDIYHLYNLH